MPLQRAVSIWACPVEFQDSRASLRNAEGGCGGSEERIQTLEILGLTDSWARRLYFSTHAALAAEVLTRVDEPCDQSTAFLESLFKIGISPT